MLRVHVAADPAAARSAIVEGLVRYNEGFLGPRRGAPLAVTAIDEAGRLVGGASGSVQYDRLLIELLWTDETHRSAGLGTRIMDAMEAEGRRLGGVRAFLDTFTFQAAPFYEKRGYVEVARIRDYFEGYDRIYLSKPL